MTAPVPREQGLDAPVPRTRVRWLVVALLFVFSFLTIVDRVAISAAKPYMAAELGIDDVAFGLIFGIFALGYALFQIPSGWAADRFGPRAFLSFIVITWSLFTGVTGVIATVPLLVGIRFLFGAAEAGIYPTASRAIYNWLPRRERGAAQGLLFVGSRLGAAFGLSVVSFVIAIVGWRGTFGLLSIAGLVLAFVWFTWFRNTPAENARVSAEEIAHIADRADRGAAAGGGTGASAGVSNALNAAPDAPAASLWTSDAGLLALQYFASNFTFFIAFSWLLPYLHTHYGLSAAAAGAYASLPLYFGAFGNWLSGALVDRIYRQGHWTRSRRLPAIIGFVLGAAGLLAAPSMPTVLGAVICFSIATLGVDMTLSPSWTACQDLAGARTGLLSGAMNTLGNVGSFVSSITFPLLLQQTGSAAAYFYLAAVLNIAAIFCWWRIRPDRPSGSLASA
jgi:ACS family glucarate transporter-like MFS transporter